MPAAFLRVAVAVAHRKRRRSSLRNPCSTFSTTRKTVALAWRIKISRTPTSTSFLPSTPLSRTCSSKSRRKPWAVKYSPSNISWCSRSSSRTTRAPKDQTWLKSRTIGLRTTPRRLIFPAKSGRLSSTSSIPRSRRRKLEGRDSHKCPRFSSPFFQFIDV